MHKKVVRKREIFINSPMSNNFIPPAGIKPVCMKEFEGTLFCVHIVHKGMIDAVPLPRPNM